MTKPVFNLEAAVSPKADVLPSAADGQDTDRRAFVFLQGPPGPLFHRLALSLRANGATVERFNICAGDRNAWPELAREDPSTQFGGEASDKPTPWTSALWHTAARRNSDMRKSRLPAFVCACAITLAFFTPACGGSEQPPQAAAAW